MSYIIDDRANGGTIFIEIKDDMPDDVTTQSFHGKYGTVIVEFDMENNPVGVEVSG